MPALLFERSERRPRPRRRLRRGRRDARRRRDRSSGSSSRCSRSRAAPASSSTSRSGSTASGRRAVVGACSSSASPATLLFALGLSRTAVLGAALLVAGLADRSSRAAARSAPAARCPILGDRAADGRRGDPPRPHRRVAARFIAPGRASPARSLLVVGPWLWQLAGERTERIRLEERAEVAARIHDSVLQTLALVQRHADDPRASASLARRQERELRRWLYGSGVGDAATLVDALAEAAADVEELHGVRIELASAGDAPLDEPLAPARARRARGDDERGQVLGRRRDRRLRRGRTPTPSRCSSATAAPASTAPPCRPTGAASPSRSRARMRARRRHRDDRHARPARAPRSS